MEKYIIVTTLCKDKKVAESICDTLLNKNLVAGCQVTKVDSKYWWKGNLELSHEYKLEFRTVASFYDLIEEEIKGLHEYEIPEISCVEMFNASAEFLEWIDHFTTESYTGEEDEQEESAYEEEDFGLI